MSQNKQAMLTYFKNAQINLTTVQQEQFWKLYQLFVEYNKEYDLSRLKRFDDIIQKHFIDSAVVTSLTELPSPLLDIGTGPGFPGIPLKIMCPGLKLILAEPRTKRVLFMEMVIKKLGLKDVTIYPHLVTDNSHFTINGVITRALESIDETMIRVNHFLPANGHILYMKGPDADSDISNISKINREYYTIKSDKAYTLPDSQYERRLVIIQKTKESFARSYVIFHNIKETIGQSITSPDNKRFKEFKKLCQAAGIKKEGKIIVAGKKIISEINDPEKDSAIVVYDGYKEQDQQFDTVLQKFEEKHALYILKRELYNTLDQFKTNSPLLIKPVKPLLTWDNTLANGCTLLIPFQDPANVGSVIRSAAGFGIKKIIMLQEAAHPFHPKAIRTSAGTVFQVDLYKGPSINELEKFISEYKVPLITLDKSGADIKKSGFPDQFLLLPGVEGPGLPEKLKQYALAIPLDNNVESLNAAISTSIVLYEWHKHKLSQSPSNSTI